jgi:hypothetical protein
LAARETALAALRHSSWPLRCRPVALRLPQADVGKYGTVPTPSLGPGPPTWPQAADALLARCGAKPITAREP